MMIRKFIYAVVIGLFSGGFYAQNGLATDSQSEVEETGVWVGAYLKLRLTDKMFYYGEHHYRRRNSLDNVNDFAGRMRQIYNRAGLMYIFNEYFNVIVGPTLVANYTPRPGDDAYDNVVWEPRIWHQWLFSMPSMGRVKIYHQFRFEHRWKKSNFKGSEFDYTNRYRYKLYAYIPLNKKKIENKTLFLAPSAEIFMHSGKSIVYDPFEDFRVYTGLGYVLNKNITFFGGHMWTFGQKSTGYEYSKGHIIRLNVFVNLDLRNSKKIIPNVRLDD